MSGKRGTKAPDRWVDMTKFDSIAAAHEATGERALDAIDGALSLLSYFATAHGRAAVRQHVDAYAGWKMEPRDTATVVASSGIGLGPNELVAVMQREEAGRGDVIGAIAEAQVDKWLEMFDAMIGRGQAFYVSPRMARIAMDIAQALEPMPLFPTDVPTTTGYLWLGSAMRLNNYGADDDGTALDVSIPIRVLAWDAADVKRPDSWAATTFAGTGVQGPYVSDDDIAGDIGPGVALMGLSDGSEIRDALRRFELDKGVPQAPWPDSLKWVPWETTGWAFGTDWRQATGEEDSNTDVQLPAGVVNEGNTFIRKFMFAVWRLIREEVAVVEPFRPDRHAARRMARQAPNFGDLQVIRLRRIYDPLVELTEDERGERLRLEREWSHRWRVSEHWAWRACGPNRSERRLVKIASYVKGPEHLPLIEKDKVYSLER